jgi:DNA (cytosine-5)-methyltransferase 1
MGGFIEGFNSLGVRTSLANDIEKDCTDTIRSTHADCEVICASIEDSSWYSEGEKGGQIDILSAGFPCQPFSIAGEQEGFKDKKNRGNLFFNIIDFCEAQTSPPKVLLLENVTNLVRKDNGAWINQILNSLRKVGYWVGLNNCHIVNSAEVTPTVQNRERVYIVAYHSAFFTRNHYKLPPIEARQHQAKLTDYVDFHSKQEDRLYLDQDNKYFIKMEKAAGSGCRKRLYQLRRTEVRVLAEDYCPTLTANMGGGGHNVPFVFDDFGLRRLTVNECASLQGYDSENLMFAAKITDGAKLKMIGNAVDPKVITWLSRPIIDNLESI